MRTDYAYVLKYLHMTNFADLWDIMLIKLRVYFNLSDVLHIYILSYLALLGRLRVLVLFLRSTHKIFKEVSRDNIYPL